MSVAVAKVITWMEQGLIPQKLMRLGMRSLIRDRALTLHPQDCELAEQVRRNFVESMQHAEVAPLPDQANEQHYEVPAEFYELVLGSHKKYSCCLWDQPRGLSLDHAERRALEVTCIHADIQNGQEILELGCGWGSLTLWLAEHYPDSCITAVSNSASQRAYIERQASERLLGNIQVITADMNDFETEQQFDRIVSVEMFEHMRNWSRLYSRVAGWLRDDGLFFKHVFCHREVPYEFADRDSGDWMSRYFFTGGMMPSDDLPLYFQGDLELDQRWRWSGEHYRKTAEAWAANMDANREKLMPVLRQTYGEGNGKTWFMRWKMFFLACAELFGYQHGQEWWVSHYRFKKRPSKRMES